MKNTLIAVLVSVAAVFGGIQSAQAQGSVAISENQFNDGGSYAVLWGINNDSDFYENGNLMYTSDPAIQFGGTSITWNISISINSSLGQVTYTATTDYFPGQTFANWNYTSPMSSTAPVYNLLLANVYQANNGESMTTSGITLNDGIPIDSGNSLTANSSQNFAGISITDPDGINNVDYLLTVNIPSGLQNTDGNGDPAVFNSVDIPSAAPEPSVLAFAVLGLGSVLGFKKLRG